MKKNCDNILGHIAQPYFKDSFFTKMVLIMFLIIKLQV